MGRGERWGPHKPQGLKGLPERALLGMGEGAGTSWSWCLASFLRRSRQLQPKGTHRPHLLPRRAWLPSRNETGTHAREREEGEGANKRGEEDKSSFIHSRPIKMKSAVQTLIIAIAHPPPLSEMFFHFFKLFIIVLTLLFLESKYFPTLPFLSILHAKSSGPTT